MSFRFYETGYFSDRVLGIDFCKENSLIKVNLLSRLTLPFFFSFFTFESFWKLWILTFRILVYIYILYQVKKYSFSEVCIIIIIIHV